MIAKVLGVGGLAVLLNLMAVFLLLWIGIMLEAYSLLGNPGKPDNETGDPEVMTDATLKGIATRPSHL